MGWMNNFSEKAVEYFTLLPFSSHHSVTNLTTKIAVNKVVITPINNVTANPLIGPSPKKYKINAVIIVVTFESKIAGIEFLNPSEMAICRLFPSLNSSLILSYMITLASTAIAMVNTIPAIPGKVITVPTEANIPINKKRLVNSPTIDITPPVA